MFTSWLWSYHTGWAALPSDTYAIVPHALVSSKSVDTPVFLINAFPAEVSLGSTVTLDSPEVACLQSCFLLLWPFSISVLSSFPLLILKYYWPPPPHPHFSLSGSVPTHGFSCHWAILSCHERPVWAQFTRDRKPGVIPGPSFFLIP